MGFRGYLHRCRVHAWGCDGPHGVDSGRVESGVGGIRCDARRARASQHRLSSAPSPPCALFSPTALSGAVCSAHVDRPFCPLPAPSSHPSTAPLRCRLQRARGPAVLLRCGARDEPHCRRAGHHIQRIGGTAQAGKEAGVRGLISDHAMDLDLNLCTGPTTGPTLDPRPDL